MTPDFKKQLDRLHRGNPYKIMDAYGAIQRLKTTWSELDASVLWTFFYPNALQNAYLFFEHDEFSANDAAHQFLTDWITPKGVALFAGEEGQLSRFFKTSGENFFKNHARLVVNTEPCIVYGHEQGEEEEDEEGLSHIRKPNDPLEHNADYPYDGIDYADPESVMLTKETHIDTNQKITAIRETLFPGDREVYDLLLENYTSDDIASILERTTKAVERSLSRIREVTTANRG